MTILPFPPLIADDRRLVCSLRTELDTCVVSLVGDLDYATADQVRHVLLGVAESSTATTIVLDLSRVDFLDASGVGVIVQGATIAELDGRTVQVAGLHGLPRRVFALVGLEHMATDAATDEEHGRGPMSHSDDVTPVAEDSASRAGRAELWRHGADERERLADERERIADEREALADERERLADRQDHELDRREAQARRHGATGAVSASQTDAEAQAAVGRADARVRLADAELLRAAQAAARVAGRAARLDAAAQREDAADRSREADDADEAAWAADRRDFVAAERQSLADERERVADERDMVADLRDRSADARERDALARERDLGRRLLDPGVTGAGGPQGRACADAADAAHRRAAHRLRRDRAAAARGAAAEDRARAAAAWAPDEFGPRLAGTFADLAQQIVGGEDLAGVLPALLRSAVESVPACDWAAITLWRDARVVDTVATHPVAHHLDQLQARTGVGPAPEVLERTTPTNVPRLHDPARWPQVAAAASRLGVGSCLTDALLVRRHPTLWEPLGTMTLYSATPAGFDDHDEQVITLLCSYAAVAVSMIDRRADLDHREAALHRALSSRDVIGQAKGILMERRRLSAGDAFDVLRHASQRLNRRLLDVADQLARTGELP